MKIRRKILRLFCLEMIHFHVEQLHEIRATIDEIHGPIGEVMSMDKQ